jgi:soluble lytic murein transglycosylase-like protein
MRFVSCIALALLAAAALAAPARAAFPHTVTPGESLWSIATTDGLDPAALAAYNGLPADSPVVLGTTVLIPPMSSAAGPVQGTGTTAPLATTSATAADDDAAGSVSAAPAASTPAPMGGYTVQPGDTLSGLAARSGVSVAQMAYMNGLSPDAHIIAGTALKLPTGSPVSSSSTGEATPTAATTTTEATPAAPSAPPYPTATRMTSSEIGQIAAANGVSSSLASAVAWQESGFNNGAVSSAGARGTMQVMPGTWNWVERNISGPLDPASPTDNVKAGTLYLGRLLRDTGGNVSQAVAGYYQGLGSVASRGMYPSTQRYVNNVLALQGRFGG